MKLTDTHNEPTKANAYYPYSGGSEIPPPPPHIHKARRRTIIFMGVVCVVLVIVMGGYVIDTNKKPQKTNDSFMLRLRTTPTITLTTNLNYTASDIMKDIRRIAYISPPDNYQPGIYSWSFNTWTSNVPFTSSSTFGDYSACGGRACTPPQVGIWVYASKKDTLDAYNEITNQISEGKVPGGPVGIVPVAYMHGRCLLLGASRTSIYGQVVTQHCV